MQVSSDGYISMGERPRFNSANSLNLPGSDNVVAPFGADTNTVISGTVQYTSFARYPRGEVLRDVSAFIASETGESFEGKKMMLASWRKVSEHEGDSVRRAMFHWHNFALICILISSYSQSTTNDFQCADGIASYAVFIYECGGMEWGGGVIGWQANSSIFEEHFLSDKPNSNVIGCWYSNSYSAVVYRLDCKYKYM